MSRTRLVVAGCSAICIAMGAIMGFEGKRNHAYLDPAPVSAIPTICWGHTQDVQMGDYATDEQCVKFLEEDVKIAAAAVDRLVKVEITDDTRAALISFVYNVGEGNFAKSTLLRKLNAGDIAGACNELPRWVYSQGKVLKGLVHRRAAERELCVKGVQDAE